MDPTPAMDVQRIRSIIDACIVNSSLAFRNPENEIVCSAQGLTFIWDKLLLEAHSTEMVQQLCGWPSDCWLQRVPPLGEPPLGEEINLFVAMAVLGSLGEQAGIYAIALFMFGKALGWWEVLEPGSTEGVISIIGYTP